MNKRWIRQFGSIVMAMLLMMSAILGDVMPVYAELLEDVSKNDQVIAEETELENPEVEELLENDNARVKAGDIVTNDKTMLLSPDASEENGEISNDTSANETDGSIELLTTAPEPDYLDILESDIYNHIDIQADGMTDNNEMVENDGYSGGVIGDDYPYSDAARDSFIDPWNFYVCECTSFCAHRLNKINNIGFHNHMGGVQWGHAKDWDDAARALGYTVDMNPAIGSIAYYEAGVACGNGYYAGSTGHVAWVAEVNGDTVIIEEYNGNPMPNDGVYSTRPINKYTPSGYIHIKDIQPTSIPTPAPEPPKGSVMQTGCKQVVPNGYYQIVSMLDNNYALDIQGYDSFEDAPNAQLFRNRDVDQDVFELTYNGKFYTIRHVLSGKYLDVENSSQYNAANVIAYKNNGGGDNQQWAIFSVGDSVFQIKAKISGYSLDVFGAVAEDRKNICVHEWNGGDNQKWRLVPWSYSGQQITNGNYHIISRMYDQKYGLNVEGTSGNFRNVGAAQNLTNGSQVFTVEYNVNNNAYTIKQKGTKYWLEIENAGKTRNIGVATGDANGNPDGNWKRWYIKNAKTSGWYGIINRETGDSFYYNNRNGSNVLPTYGTLTYEDQWWKFVRAVDSVSISKSSASTKIGTNITLTATVLPSSAANKNVTWSSSNTSVATVNSSGVVTPKAAGTTNITVKTADGGYTATCKVTVDKIPVTGVSLNKSSTSIVAGKTETLTATVSPTNATNKSVTWTSSNTSIATVSSTGVVTAKSAGTATITVKTADGGKTATCKVTVNPATVAVTGVSINSSNGWSVYGTKDLTIGKTEVLTAVITPSNATNKSVTWSSSNTNVATISNTGLVTAKAEGTATITVKTEDGSKSATCTITVGTIPVITTNSLPGGKAGQEYVYIFEAAGTKPIEWCMLDFWCDDNNSANDIFSGLGDENGRLSLYLKHGGNIRITVEASNRYGATSKEFSIAFIEDKPDIVESTTIVAGQKINLKETCFRNVDESISRYIVDNKMVATISKTMLSGVKAGTVNVTAQSLVGKNRYEDVATCNVMVLNKPKLKFGIPMTYEGQKIYASDYFTTSDTNTLGATYWESSNPSVVEVIDSAQGSLIAHGNGDAKITAYFGEKGKAGTFKVSANINVKKPSFAKASYKLMTGEKIVIAAKNINAKSGAKWRIADSAIASAQPQLDTKGNPTGKVILKGNFCGDTRLTAVVDGQEYSIDISVAAPTIDKKTMKLTVGKTGTVKLKNTKYKRTDIEWYSSNPDVAIVDVNGKIKGISSGEAIIYTATGNVWNQCVVTVL